MTNEERDKSPAALIAEKYGEQKLVDALLRLRAGHDVEEVRTFYPMTAGVLEDAWSELQEEFDVERVDSSDQDVHARSLKFSNPIDPTLAKALKGLHGPKLEDSTYHPDRYYAPTVLSMSWHEPTGDGERTAEKGFLMVYELGGGAGYLIEGQAGEEFWTVGVKAFEKELIHIFKPEHRWKIDYTTGEKIRTMLKTIGVYERNLSPRFDEDQDVRDYPEDYEPSSLAESDWPARIFEAYE